MSASNPSQHAPLEEDDNEELLNADDAAEEIAKDDDHPMEDEDDAEDDLHEEIQLQNDSAAHFDSHTDSIFCIAQHPLRPSLIVTGGGDDVAYLFDASIENDDPRPLLPTSYESDPQPKGERKSIPPLQKLDGHTDSVNAVAFTQPSGQYIVTAGLDGKLRAWFTSSTASSSSTPESPPSYTFLSESSEVQEINWLSPCPSPAHPNTVAFGANDGSVWVYTVDAADTASPLTINQAYYLHTESCTAGAWTPDGNLLATVSEDSSFHVYDIWGEAADAGITSSDSGQAIISLSATDQRFAVEGGLYCVTISPGGTIAAVGGAGGNIRIIGLPRVGTTASASTPTTRAGGAGGPKNKPSAGARKPGPSTTTTTTPSSSSPGTLLASLNSQSDSIETLSFSSPPLILLASGSVDGSIALFDVAHSFALRRHIADAHDGFAVVKVDFVAPPPQQQGAGKRGVIT
ncbi:hypothetical protein EPUS_06535 [Endocarpon pusillum Z07020]|uniref:Uncharacterized protein n=1 Tax=Endocarpon pusillum (strain Z07020 / HMAS-L-300199) TaxID=1263415 RepID=U1HUS7_ENDPU|nr:uncharacterized protein EPUS_06535 [Endocarpon pusillum Z07020]ERF73074.1 hypothetical protein EPUS_06535 [Endocarpon pusillum Z07020]